MREWLTLGNGDILFVHSREACDGEGCCIHNPSDHALSDAPFIWRSDLGIMERQCPHGIGHPDPDSLRRTRRRAWPQILSLGVHGCDGCCARPAPGWASLGEAAELSQQEIEQFRSTWNRLEHEWAEVVQDENRAIGEWTTPPEDSDSDRSGGLVWSDFMSRIDSEIEKGVE